MRAIWGYQKGPTESTEHLEPPGFKSGHKRGLGGLFRCTKIMLSNFVLSPHRHQYVIC